MQNQAAASFTTFVPTNDWQDIQEGQPIPPGLHIRMNLTTGKKEAKLLDRNEKQEKSSMAVALCAQPDSSSEPTPKET